jgi:ABC-type Zn uptake system ZnuABC Zn-binding protein ZnuA
MKKYIPFILVTLMVIFCLSGCFSSMNKQSNESGKFHIVTTIFPAYGLGERNSWRRCR